MSIGRRPWSVLALGMGVILGFAMPIGDTVPALASPAERVVPAVEPAADPRSSQVVSGTLDPVTGPAEGGTPVTVSIDDAPAFVSTAAGDGFGLGLTSDGEVAAWGAGDRGQLGDGKATESSTPVLLPADAFGGEPVTAVAAGSRTGYAVTATGKVYAWGAGDQGQLGNGTAADSAVPVRIGAEAFGGEPVAGLAAGDGVVYAAVRSGAVYVWGGGAAPAVMPGLSGAVQLAASGSQAVALTGAGEVFAWSAGEEPGAVDVSGVDGAVAQVAASGELFSLRTDGGNGTGTAFSWQPGGTPVAVVPGATAVAVGGGMTLALTAAGEVLAWGADAQAGAVDLTGMAVLEGAVPAALAAGGGAGYMLAGGAVFGWGAGAGGRLGTGDAADEAAPVLGPNFRVTGVSFGDQPGSEVVALSPAAATAVTPQHEAGSVDVQLSYALRGGEQAGTVGVARVLQQAFAFEAAAEPDAGQTDEAAEQPPGPQPLQQRSLISPLMAGDSTTPNAYFSLRQQGTPGGTGDDRGTISAIVDKYVVDASAPSAPVLAAQSSSHPTQSVSVALEGDRQSDSMPATPGNGVTRYQYRVGQTNFSANSLGVATNGDAYFTVQFYQEQRSQASECSGLVIFGFCLGTWGWGSWSGWSQQTTRYLSIWRVNIDTGATAQLVTRETGYADDITGGAVNTAGVFHFSRVSSHTSPANSMRYFIYRVNGSAITLATTATTVTNSQPHSATAYSGDIAFDGYNNLHVLVGGTGASSRVSMLTAAQVPASGSSSPTSIAVTSVPQTTPSGSGMEPAGIAFPYDTRTVWQAGDTHSLRNMTALGTQPSGAQVRTYTSPFVGQRDLASIVRTPTFQLKLLIVGGRANASDQFTLSATPGTSATTRSTSGTQGEGTATTVTGTSMPINVTRALDTPLSATNPTATVPFSVAGVGATNLANYAQSTSCVNLTTGLAVGTPSAGVSGSAAVSGLGNANIECTVTLTRAAADLKVSKRAYIGAAELTRDTTVAPGATIQYRLLFDNSTGSAAATNIDYTDYLADILDDASYVSTAVTGTGTGSATTLTATKTGDKIAITGSVPLGATRTVTITVTVKQNATDASSRQTGAAGTPAMRGYRLNNYLAPTTEPPPGDTCAAPGTGALPTCTTNPIRAWTVTKNSQPEDGAMIHSGGNIYYRIKVTNFSGEAVTGVKLRDDLTQTLAATVLDLGAPATPFDVVWGVSYFTEAGTVIPAGNTYWTAINSGASAPTVSYVADGTGGCDVEAHYQADQAPGSARGCWTLETPTFTIPATISGQKVAYAVVGYAVRGGSAAAPSDQTGTTPDSSVAVDSNAGWVNTVQADASNVGGNAGIDPNRCSANANGGAGIPPGWLNDPTFIENYGDCKTYHLLGESYFHIWKKNGSLEPGDTGNNLLGASFVLADTEADARAGKPSRWLCRVNNNPNVGAAYVPPGSNPAVSGAEDFGEDSATHAAIAQWNRDHPGDQREQCGQFYYLSTTSQGQQAGSWRAVDVRGGDTIDGTPSGAPLDNWRTTSALTGSLPGTSCEAGTPSETSCGRHGTYWLAETVSPTDFQLLAQPMKMWVAPSSPTPGGLSPLQPGYYNYQGRLSLPVVGLGESVPSGSGANIGIGPAGSNGLYIRSTCLSPYERPVNHQPNCVMPTGWTMPVFDTAKMQLPLAGGLGAGTLAAAGGIVLLGAIGGALWWRRRLSTSQVHDSLSKEKQ